ncbi:MAG: Methylated-DNA--protein-cysteine methyltransferase [Mycoplasmataceae bacterium]|nr:Methylated-DNA--protein-cysteine methyltransferase [Mycoplasmataceae bacterium]WNE41448.1 MAG: Methylated-DNA--protein-cysteine methyltransferase [Mycoplasmataceae bacterium]
MDKIINPVWDKVYKLCSQIPVGFVSNYKEISSLLLISPRTVGQALKNNPYDSNKVPCHRVISSNYFIGGFRGQWGEGEKVSEKFSKLLEEGVLFDEKGFVLKPLREKVFFKNFVLNI